MFAVAFDLDVAQTLALHPSGVGQAYRDGGAVLDRDGFNRIQGSVDVAHGGDLVAVTLA